MKKEITVRVTKVYGNDTVYPVCDMSKLFCQIAKKKTLSTFDVGLLKMAGWTINVETPTL